MSADQTHCSICAIHLRGRGVKCAQCGWLHTKCSGLSASKDWFEGFKCIRCNGLVSAESRVPPIQNQTVASPAAIEDQGNDLPDPVSTTEPPQHETLPPVTQTEPHSADTAPEPNPPVTSSPDTTTEEQVTAQDFWRNIQEKRHILKRVYEQVVHWKPVFFILSKNKVGFSFVESLNSLLSPIANNSCNSDVALYAACIMPHLVLPKTKTEIDGSISKIIGRRLKQWNSGKIEDLLEEATALQRRLTRTTKAKKDKEIKEFNSLVEKGKISSSIRCLTEKTGGVLSLSDKINGETVEEILERKHPPATPADIQPDRGRERDNASLPQCNI